MYIEVDATASTKKYVHVVKHIGLSEYQRLLNKLQQLEIGFYVEKEVPLQNIAQVYVHMVLEEDWEKRILESEEDSGI